MVLQAIRYEAATDSSASSLKILDQLALPHRSTYFSISTCEDAHAAIKQMRVRGAPAIAIVAALALAVEMGPVPGKDKLPEDAKAIQGLIGARLDYLKTSRPTAVNLADAVGKLKIVAKRAALEPGASGDTVARQYILAAEAMLVHDVQDNEAIGRHGAKWIEEHTVAGGRCFSALDELRSILMRKHRSLATAGYGTALGVIRALYAAELLTRAYCSETRPYNQGSRLTAFELVHDKIPATLITDSMAAALLAQEGDNIAAIVVGADRVAANGDTANKIGTYSLAILAKHHGVKFLVAAPRTTIDLATKSGADIEIEERAAVEVTRVKGPIINNYGQVLAGEEAVTISTAAEGIEVWNPAFDITPADLIDGVVTEVGVVEKGKNGLFDFETIFEQNTRNGQS